jgi:hypothetical protein
MRIHKTAEVKDHIGKRLYWDDISERWSFLRSNIVVGTFRGHIEFENQDFKRIADLRNLRTTEKL